MSAERLIVVGGGLLGSIAAAAARASGRPVTVLDSGEPLAGSPAAAGLIYEPWLSSLPFDARDGLETVERLFGWERVPFYNPQYGKTVEHRMLSPVRARWRDVTRERVLRVDDGLVVTDCGEHRGCVYVAAGKWTPRLVPCPAVKVKTGVSLFYGGTTDPLLWYYSGFHYQRAYLFNREPGRICFSDGSAVLGSNWTPGHVERAASRAAGLGLPAHEEAIVGDRPFCEGGPWFGRVSPRTWAATGAAKFGTLVGGAFAARLMQELP